MSTVFNIEWGGSADLTVEEIWPDGDAPENPTTADVIEQMKKSARGPVSAYSTPRTIAADWNFEVEDIEVYGPGGSKSLFRELRCLSTSEAPTGTDR